MLSSAINSFNKYIESLSQGELEFELSKFNPENYSGPTIGELNSLSEDSYLFQTTVANCGWTNVNHPYFNLTSVMEFIDFGSETIKWDPDSFPEPYFLFDKDFDPQPSAGFLLCLPNEKRAYSAETKI